MTRIILVEDDEKLSKLIKFYLDKQNFEVTVVSDGNQATELILSEQPDVAILDLMLPGKDGLAICREIRAQFKGSILFLTASEDDMDHVAGVELGADDFIVKPIQPRVLLARIRMQLRRSLINESGTIDQNILLFGQLTIKKSTRSVIFRDVSISLTTSEFDLLWLLASHSEEILSRDFIYQELRGIEYDGMDRTIDTKVAILRKKLCDDASLSKRIITVRGKGYLFVPDTWH